MGRKEYYSTRTGNHPTGGKYDLPMLKDIVLALYDSLEGDGYFQEAFGYQCVDAGLVRGSLVGPHGGWVPGALGSDIEGTVFLALRKRDKWPLRDKIADYSEADLFDVLEFLHDHVAEPLAGTYHSYQDCGMHYETFDGPAGKAEFRKRLNVHLADYGDGYEMSPDGEVVNLGVVALRPLLSARIPADTPGPVRDRLSGAISKFRRYRASREERRAAIRDLVDVLEYLRQEAKKVITSKDESDLFNIANNFGLRHHNDTQKTDYDEDIWFSWMFYYYLATIHALIRLIAKGQGGSETA